MSFISFPSTHTGSVYMDATFRTQALLRCEKHDPHHETTPGALCDCSVMALRSQHISSDDDESLETEVFVELKSGFDGSRFMLHYAGELFLQLPGDPSLITPDATEALYHSFTGEDNRFRHHIELSCGLSIDLVFRAFEFDALAPEMPSPLTLNPAAGASRSH